MVLISSDARMSLPLPCIPPPPPPSSEDLSRLCRLTSSIVLSRRLLTPTK